MEPIATPGAASHGSASSLRQSLFAWTRYGLLAAAVVLFALATGCSVEAVSAPVLAGDSAGDAPRPLRAQPLGGPAPHVDLALEARQAVLPEIDAAEGQPAQPSAPSAIYQIVTVLPTYPLESYQSSHVDAAYNWPFVRFDRDRFLDDDPLPANRPYRLVVLENALLRVMIMPELGGRIWQVIHKPTGHTMFYQNQVVKPSPWGPANQIGWTALGGLEWNLPVIEHGYDWGTPWQVESFVDEDGSAVARIAAPDDGRLLAATVEVKLPPDAAYFEIEPQIQNISDAPLSFDYWHTAMLAPGIANQIGPELRFLVPGEAVRIHSTGDERLPGPDTVISWPYYSERDLSRLGDWDQYIGFFEYPAAHGPFVAVYDPAGDAGAVRVYPAGVAQGSKVFGLGWNDALASEYYTDDGSAYVELHGGLAPTFSEQARLDAGESIQWRERWYPVHGIGRFAIAGDAGALSWQIGPAGLTLGFYAAEPFAGHLVVSSPQGSELLRQPLITPAGEAATLPVQLPDVDPVGLTVEVEDVEGAVVLSTTVESP